MQTTLNSLRYQVTSIQEYMDSSASNIKHMTHKILLSEVLNIKTTEQAKLDTRHTRATDEVVLPVGGGLSVVGISIEDQKCVDCTQVTLLSCPVKSTQPLQENNNISQNHQVKVLKIQLLFRLVTNR
ncbi:hypothetical protein E2C01_087655 [Portunus trituberculatus]|uniref:Uncharacterized protein n=1 Tax=Portunus trituberculatus TaxID=210409 RepID=A0A5B7J760_PORTR|nr:hypothetical protein [Portunus trituberculatus]